MTKMKITLLEQANKSSYGKQVTGSGLNNLSNRESIVKFIQDKL